ncbi:translation initiation factor IF-2 [Rickettsia rickettsii]|uniref:Translation initiation factor IF-2 n=2 Tax=Rickettsia rickettsii TaxID=783 RepID=IF2_RICRO|nr:translation initiation factor IF-2 [Rickettsia rickettsii]A8GSP4.1 RecName: Full=Translation initiation factor IF-2 [Rickettsia rickettsii str. 'Sheila Smith']B0BY61.1 RecName: Full=Translation initiation factor IF-2 [Rickettsia rickettsii str. Iowa]ABV76419.1 translation initiation factor IF-2 [Rickettsia rickettsii str. 'Sheila Smith']ABY72787.1 bacterial protein translation initiation factor 2 (IF-2) [Rickettsia rickettsii str. Iowa]AFB22008.1 translation initiation factor IF-2 [Ricketts
MTDNQEIKPKKLTLGNSKLSLNKSFDSLTGAQSFVNAKSKTLVEVRKSSTGSATTLSLNKERNSLDQTVIDANKEEFNRRLSILKKAAEQSQLNDPSKISTLSKLASINQSANSKIEPLETDKEVEQKQQNTEDNKVEVSAKIVQDDKDIPSQIPKKKEETFVKSPLVGMRTRYGIESEKELDKTADSKIIAPKIKLEEPKKIKKADLFNMLSDDESGSCRTRSLASIKRAREKEKRKLASQAPEKVYREVTIPEVIGVGDLANAMSERVADVIKELMKLGILANASQTIDADTAELVATNLGHTVKRVQESDVENVLISDDKVEDLRTRAPVVTVMGHVDHGKTSLLDALKSTDVAAGELGGITQHIGAYRVTLADGRAITFIDTPGHEAFSEMRSRGAKVTDIVIIVVAADDGIKTQTVEAINHAKAAGVPIIVAINKIDKPDIDIERVKNELYVHEIIGEEVGGDVMIIPISALKKINLDKLEEAILLIAEMQDLKANPFGSAAGVVIESKIEQGRGTLTTILVQRGTLRNSDIIIAGTAYGKVKKMTNDKGLEIVEATPSVPVEIQGLNEVPFAGDKFNIVQNEKQAKDIAEYRMRLAKEKKISIAPRSSLEDLFLKASGNSKIKELPLIIKGDVQGSVEAISGSLLKLPSDEIKLRILHSGVGPITESDVSLAHASSAIIVSFNVRAGANALTAAEKEKVDIRYYSIIYHLIDDIKAIMSGMLEPIVREQYIGSAEIRQIFNITKVGKIAGSYVTKGIIKKGAGVRLLRDNVVIHEGKLKTLKRFKDEVKEVREGYECGIAFENYEDIREGDTVEVFELIQEQRQL